MSSLSKRYFTAIFNSKENGLYISSSPSSAARKIVSKLCASSKRKKVEFCIREITKGSKKKTYGPYLGEMKKLAKPIELKGQIVQYAPEVHLKKIGKKIRGGNIEGKGKLFDDDFKINYDCGYDIINLEKYGYPLLNGYKFNIVKLKNFLDKIPNCLLRKVSQTDQQFIFFKKKIYDFNDKNVIFKDNNFIIIKKLINSHYEYVVFEEEYISSGLSGLSVLSVLFKFKPNVIFKRYINIYSFIEVQISEIPFQNLIELIKYIKYKRNEYKINQQKKDNYAEQKTYRDNNKRNEYNINQKELLNPSSCNEIYKQVNEILLDKKYLKNQSILIQRQYMNQKQYQNNSMIELPNGGILGRA